MSSMHQVSAVMGQSQTHKQLGAKVNDPGGHTSSMETGGNEPG